MSYADKRKLRTADEANQDRHDFTWEEQNIPLLHTGFMERVSGAADKGTLFISFWFSNGEYKCRIQDRNVNEKAFFAAGTLVDVWTRIEAALEQWNLEWTPDNQRGLRVNGS